MRRARLELDAVFHAQEGVLRTRGGQRLHSQSKHVSTVGALGERGGSLAARGECGRRAHAGGDGRGAHHDHHFLADELDVRLGLEAVL